MARLPHDIAREEEDARLFLAQYEAPIPPAETLRVEVSLAHGSRGGLRVGLRVGVGRLYVVRSVPEFVDCALNAQRLRFGKGFTFDPADHAVLTADVALFELLREEEDHQEPDLRWVPVRRINARRLLSLLEGHEFRWMNRDGSVLPQQIAEETPRVAVEITGGGNGAPEGGGLRLHLRALGGYTPLCEDHAYYLADGRVLRLPDDKRDALVPLLSRLNRAGEAALNFSAPLAARLVGDVLPDIRDAVALSIDEPLRRRIIEGELSVRFWLDTRDGDVLLRVSLDYGSWSINPFGGSNVPPAALLMRDRRREAAVLDALAAYDFKVRRDALCLSDPQSILHFLRTGTDALGALGEVFISEAFLNIRPRRQKLSGRLKTLPGGRIRLELDSLGEGFDEDPANLETILRGLRDGMAWVRLPGGAYLDLPEEWVELAAELPEPENGAWTMSRASALSVGALWDPAALSIALSQRATRLFEGLQAPETPKTPLDHLLRPYQREGVAWLWARMNMGLGGVLADDMGLGKTVQVIAVLAHAKAAREGRTEEGGPALVLAPTSLLFNWRDELERFAPDLSAEILEGGPEARRAQLQGRAADVYIASYAQLRRDEALFDGMDFGLLVLDEAQQIKNAATNGARAVRGIRAEARFALTGTPVENHAGELWAIMDAVLPGYLGDLTAFHERFNAKGGEAWLRRRIAPFLLRRVKMDVLADLPERIDHRVTVAMTADQAALYADTLRAYRGELTAAVLRDGAARHRMRILAAITRLRQIADHPAMAFPGYQGESGKLDALIEILGSALDGGGRVLVFSQFTKMLGIVRARLDSMGLAYLYLDGSTPVAQREQLVRWYHQGVADVFLISLKAGGFGLNLTRADTVIIADPWWNPAVERQAGDRAHRIGQTSPVHVIRLIARGTVEESVARMQQAKQALAEAVLEGGEAAPPTLSEWMELLEE